MAQQPPYGQPPNQPPNQPPGNQPPWQGQPPPEVHYHQYAAPPPQKKRLGCLKIGAFAVAGLIVLGIIAAVASSAGGKSATSAPNSSASGSTPATAIPGINQVASVKNWDTKVTGVDKPGTTLVWSQLGNKAEAAGTWIVVVVEMKNTGNTNFGINSHDFQLKDGKGNTYKPSDKFSASTYSTFKGGQQVGDQVPPGATVRYYIPFDVGTDATGLQFQFLQGNKPLIDLGQNAS